jgi:hypothetical protein
LLVTRDRNFISFNEIKKENGFKPVPFVSKFTSLQPPQESKEEFSEKVQKVLDHNRVEEDVYLRFMDRVKEDRLDQLKQHREQTSKQDSVRNRIKVTKNPVMELIPKFFAMHIMHTQASMNSVHTTDEAEAERRRAEDARTTQALSELKLKFGGMASKFTLSPTKVAEHSEPSNFTERALNLTQTGSAKEEDTPKSPMKGSATQRNIDSLSKHNTFFSLIQSRKQDINASKIARLRDISDKGFEMRPAARESFVMGIRPSPLGVTQEVYFVGGIGSEIVSTIDSYNLGTPV